MNYETLSEHIAHDIKIRGYLGDDGTHFLGVFCDTCKEHLIYAHNEGESE